MSGLPGWRNCLGEPAAAAELLDYEAVGQSTVSRLRTQALFAPHTPVSQARGVGGANNAPVPAIGHGAFSRSVRGHTVGSHSTIRAQALVRGATVCRPSNLYPPRRPFVRPPSSGKTASGTQSCELTRLAPVGSRGDHGRTRAIITTRRRRSRPSRSAMARRPGAWPNSAPGSCGPALLPLASCAPCPG